MIVLAALLPVSAAFFLSSPLNETVLDEFENLVNVSRLNDFLQRLEEDSTFNYTTIDAEELAQLKERFEKSKMNERSIPPGNKVHEDNINDVNAKAGIEGVMYQGDILLTDEQMEILEEQAKDKNAIRSHRQANSDGGWGHNPTIPYSFADQYPTDRVPMIEHAMKFWSDNTCVSFRKATSEDKNRVEVQNGSGCSSRIGKTGEEAQPLSLSAGCMTIATITHELAHTFGIRHTQARTDRDKYVYVDKENIQDGEAHNFNIEQNTVGYIPYEFGSVMHYVEGTFANDTSKPVLYARRGYEMYQHGMSGRLPTFYDVMLVNKMFNCYANCPNSETIACTKGGVVDVRNCKQCKCPFGWTGRYCKKRPDGTKRLAAKENEQTFQVQMGTQGANDTLVIESQFYVITAPAGKHVEVTPSYKGTEFSSSCGNMGSIIQFKTDPRSARVQICDFRVNYSPIVSEKNVVVIEVYTRGALTLSSFTYRSV